MSKLYQLGSRTDSQSDDYAIVAARRDELPRALTRGIKRIEDENPNTSSLWPFKDYRSSDYRERLSVVATSGSGRVVGGMDVLLRSATTFEVPTEPDTAPQPGMVLAAGQIPPALIEFEYLRVDPKYRTRGLGRLIFEAAIEHGPNLMQNSVTSRSEEDILAAAAYPARQNFIPRTHGSSIPLTKALLLQQLESPVVTLDSAEQWMLDHFILYGAFHGYRFDNPYAAQLASLVDLIEVRFDESTLTSTTQITLNEVMNADSLGFAQLAGTTLANVPVLRAQRAILGVKYRTVEEGLDATGIFGQEFNQSNGFLLLNRRDSDKHPGSYTFGRFPNQAKRPPGTDAVRLEGFVGKSLRWLRNRYGEVAQDVKLPPMLRLSARYDKTG
jgi:GNAT superfamily N-acetyltransferase